MFVKTMTPAGSSGITQLNPQSGQRWCLLKLLEQRIIHTKYQQCHVDRSDVEDTVQGRGQAFRQKEKGHADRPEL